MNKELIALGLSEDEAKIYIALLEIGETTAGSLIKKTGLHRQIVYNVLEKLVRRDFVKVLTKRKAKHWTANDPHIILTEIREKESLAKEIIPKLLSMGVLAKHQQEVRLYEGGEGLAEMILKQMQSASRDSEYLVIGSSPLLYTEAIQRVGAMEKIEKMRIQNRVHTKLIFSEKERENAKMALETFFEGQPKEMQREYRYLPEYFDSPVGIHIWENAVNLVIYGNPLLCIEIQSKSLSQNFSKYFLYLWNVAKK